MFKIFVKILIFILLLRISKQEEQGSIENVKIIIDSPLQDIQWCGMETNLDNIDFANDTQQPAYLKKKVLVLSNKGTIYLSLDEGKKFENIKEKLIKVLEKSNFFNSEIDKEKASIIKKIIISEIDQNFIFLQGLNEIAFVSSDCGENIRAIKIPGSFADIKLSHTDKNLILGANRKECKENETFSEFCTILMDLYVSTDQGNNWKLLKNNSIEYSWGCINKYYKNIIPVERIIVTQLILQQNEVKTNIVYSDDYFQNFKMIADKGYRFFLTNEYLYVLETLNFIEKKFKLKICNNYYREYKLENVEIPIQRVKDHSFTILDSSESNTYINVNHYGDDAKMGNVYMSNLDGTKFVLSLLHNVRDNRGYCDFEKIKSIEGVYIANHYDFQMAESYKLDYSYFNEDQSKRKKDNLDLYRKSVISHDKGGTWLPINAPEKDISGVSLHCNGECSLHLKGYTDKSANPIYSSATSIGIIIGVGNTGLFLSGKPDETNTYFSRDAGYTWYEIARGSHIYEIGDHGGLIVMVNDNKATNKLKYSWNEGKNWIEYVFSEEEIDVTNIIIEPLNMGLKFIIYGTKSLLNQTKLDGVLIYLDFSTLNKRVCSGIWNPGAPESDFETWFPGIAEKSKCMFGKRLKYIRRKRDRECFNGEDFEKKQIVDFCPCTEDDWECDYGYYRVNGLGECIAISKDFEIKKNNFSVPENCTDYYDVPSGYRKVPGDYCVGGVEKTSKRYPCNPNKPQPFFRKENFKNEEIKENISGFWTTFKYIVFFGILIGLIIWQKEKIMSVYTRIVKKVKKGHEKQDYYQKRDTALNRMNEEDDDF